ncbi:putative membrane protein [Pseudomonas sp. TE3786]
MKVFLHVGKTAVAVFWLLVLVNLFSPLNKPVDLLLDVLGGLVLLAHVLELGMFGNRLRGLENLNLHRLQVLLFGIFHLYGLAEPEAAAVLDAVPAPIAEPVAEPPAVLSETAVVAAPDSASEVQHA